MSFRRMALCLDDWREPGGGYSTQTDPQLVNVAGLTAPWLMGTLTDRAFIVFDIHGVKAADFLVEGASDAEAIGWVNALPLLNVPTVLWHPRWQVPTYWHWRVAITNFVADPAFGDNRINIYVES